MITNVILSNFCPIQLQRTNKQTAGLKQLTDLCPPLKTSARNYTRVKSCYWLHLGQLKPLAVTLTNQELVYVLTLGKDRARDRRSVHPTFLSSAIHRCRADAWAEEQERGVTLAPIVNSQEYTSFIRSRQPNILLTCDKERKTHNIPVNLMHLFHCY